MRKKVVLLPVGSQDPVFLRYVAVFETGSGFAKTQAELAAALSRLQAPSDDFRDLFLEYAEPAFNRFLFRRGIARGSVGPGAGR